MGTRAHDDQVYIIVADHVHDRGLGRPRYHMYPVFIDFDLVLLQDAAAFVYERFFQRVDIVGQIGSQLVCP